MHFTWDDGKEKTKWIYWAESISYEEFEKAILDCDYLQIWYPKYADRKIYNRYKEVLSIVEGSEYNFGDKVYSKSIDLTMGEKEIFINFKKNRRYETRRALERDKVEATFIFPTKKDKNVDDCILFYNTFAAEKNRAPIDERKLLALVNAHMFVIGKVNDKSGRTLVINTYIVCEEMKVASLYTSASLFRSNPEDAPLIGRANGYLQYMAMCLFKQKGLTKYDLGGFYTGKTDQQRMNISEYKSSFGGKFDEFQVGFTIRADELRNVEKNLIAYKEDILNKKVIIYGMASWGKYVARRIKELYSVIPECMIDNKLYLTDSRFCKEDILQKYNPKEVILIVTTLYENYAAICAGMYARSYFNEGNAHCFRGAK